MKKIARIFEDVGGIYICDDDTNLLDTRGRAHPTKVAALMAAARDGSRMPSGLARIGVTKFGLSSGGKHDRLQAITPS